MLNYDVDIAVALVVRLACSRAAPGLAKVTRLVVPELQPP